MEECLVFSSQLGRPICVQCPEPVVLHMDVRSVRKHMKLHGVHLSAKRFREYQSLYGAGSPWLDVDTITHQREVSEPIAHLKVKQGVVCPIQGCAKVFSERAWYKHRKEHSGISVDAVRCKYQTVGKLNVRITHSQQLSGVQESSADVPEQDASAVEEQSRERLLRELQLDVEEAPQAFDEEEQSDPLNMTQTCAVQLMDEVWLRRRDVYFKVMLESTSTTQTAVSQVSCLRCSVHVVVFLNVIVLYQRATGCKAFEVFKHYRRYL